MTLSLSLSPSSDPPSIISSFDSVSQFASLSINISCTAKGDGQIKWLWRNNTQTISQSTNIHYTVTGLVSFLVIESLDVFSNVTLQCVAYTNDSLIAAASNNLYVQSKLLFLPWLHSLFVC